MSSIMTVKDEHRRYCGQPEGGWLGDMDPKTHFRSRNWGDPGDVRRCVHGYVMLGYEVPGVIPYYWQTLHPIWTPWLYRRAVRALKEG